MTEHYETIKRLYPKFLSPRVSLEYPEGWNKIVDSLFESVSDYYYTHIENEHFFHSPPLFCQLKEKFGTGRFYIDALDEKPEIVEGLYNIISLHEERCASTCEMCGYNDASLKIKGMLLSTRCSAHSLAADGWSSAADWRKALDR
jgi:hypothetical protein